MSAGRPTVRHTRPEDFPAIVTLSSAIYGPESAWTPALLASHLEVFPEGQLVTEVDGRVVGMAASLIVLWDDYSIATPWRDFTAGGTFTNHDPEHGHTLYGAEIMVDPAARGRGCGSAIYEARWALVERLNLLRVRAGARIRGYHRYAHSQSPEAYVRAVVAGELRDPTLSFQLARGFRVIGVSAGYLRFDRESQGHAAIIERLNDRIATDEDRRAQRRWSDAAQAPSS